MKLSISKLFSYVSPPQRIPETFIKNNKIDFSAAVTLTVPDGHVWRIGLRKLDNKIWLTDGWSEFLQRYTIRVGYFLLFRYEGSSAFSVFIFNLTSSEINYRSTNDQLLNTARHTRIFEEFQEEDAMTSLPPPPPPPPCPVNNKVFGQAVNHFTFTKGYDTQRCSGSTKLNSISTNWANNSLPANQSTSHIGFQLDTVEFKNVVKLDNNATQEVANGKKRGRKKIKIDSDENMAFAQNEEEADMPFRFYESASVRKRTVTAEERERAINAAKVLEPSNPFCRVVLRPSYLYRGCIMYLPSCFAEKYLNGVSGFIKLEYTDGKQWPVRCLYRGGRAKLSQGWFEFTLENNLGEGDVCVFELIRARDFVLKVTAFCVNQMNQSGR
ncbi:hypothetical protein ACFE04_008725 [Oxalis oulophora]